MIRHFRETTGFSLSSLKMENDMDVKTIQAIESILKRGNNANVRRKAVGTWSSRSKRQSNQAPRRL